jgi:hypothetical protein
MDDVLAVKESVTEQFIGLKSVNGIGVGHKWVDGKPTDSPAILVFVQKKSTKANVIGKFSASELIPDRIDGIPTDVLEVGDIVKQGYTSKIRPIQPGYSCSHRSVTAGTIGGIFLDKDKHPVVLSNNHVLANENAAKIGDVIYQPGTLDSRGNMEFTGWNQSPSNSPYFATLKDYVILNANGNVQDSAIARIHESFISSGMVNLLYPTINRPLAGFATPAVNTPVQKVGRTTGYTTGRIIGLSATFTIGYDFGPARFNNCVVLTSMSDGGDSGSLILDMNMNAVALLFAGSDKVTIANPIATVVNRYGLSLYNPGTPLNPSFELDDGKWQTATVHGNITTKPDSIEISSPANAYCVIQRNISSFKSIRVTVNTGTDQGLSWGPGMSVLWPANRNLKINLRRKNTYAATLNGKETTGIGRVMPNKEYVLRIKRDNNTYVGEIMGDGVWTTVITVPTSVLSGNPTTLLIGKTNKRGTLGDYSALGQTGICSFRDLDVQF